MFCFPESRINENGGKNQFAIMDTPSLSSNISVRKTMQAGLKATEHIKRTHSENCILQLFRDS